MFKNLFSLSGFTLCTTCLLLAGIVFINRKTKLHRLWVVLNLSVALWGFGSFLIGNASSLLAAIFYWKIAYIGGIFIPIFFFHTTAIFCDIENKLKKVIIFSYIQGSLFLLLLPTNLVISRLRFIFNSFYYNESSGILHLILFIIWVSLVIGGLLELFIYYRLGSGSKRNQILYFFLGTGVGFIGGTSNFFPMFKINVYPIGNFTIPLYCLIVTYAIIRYRLMDVRVAITRAGVFVIVYTLVLGLPFILATRYKNLLIEFFGLNWWMSPLILMAALATIGPFIYIFVSRKAEEKLLREQKRYQNTLKQASMGMVRIRNLRRLLDLITHIVTKTVRISYAAIYLYNEEANEYVLQVSRDKGRIPIPKVTSDNPLIAWISVKREPLIYEEIKRQAEESHNETFKQIEESMRLLTATVVIPTYLEDKFLGIFVLGDKISGQIYTPDDLYVFQILASQAALAIENAQFYEETKEMTAQVAQAENMATIGTMADGLSHQINNRFNALSLIAGDTIDTIKLTDTSKCTPEVKEMVDQVNHALQRIQSNVIQGGEVVRGLLKYSRTQDDSHEALDLNTIIDNTLEMVQFKVKLPEIDIIRDFNNIPKIKGNMTQLEEVFFNFIDNAYDATVERRTTLKEDGYRGRITISAKPKDAALEIVVQDNGMGVKEEDFKKLFTPFFTTKVSNRKGTGLGLYVIKRIITDMHAGKINLESEYKVGTRFIIELPIAK